MADGNGGIGDTADNKAGAAPVDNAHRQSRPSSANREAGEETTTHLDDEEHNYLDGEAGNRELSAGSRDREDRVRLVRERQNNERARKLEELRSQALAAQRFREQKEEERRKRIDEMRTRDSDRRQQVEERKRAIWEAEKERREAIVRRNEEREARLEVRRRSGATGVFAFGSSTPRMLEPADTGGTFWGHRRATSTSNMMFAALPLSRRSSERELDPSKKRASSASGLDRQPGEDYRVSAMYEVFQWNEFGATDNARHNYHHYYGNQGERNGPKDREEDNQHDGAAASVARRKTDLVPTIPISRCDVRTPRSPGRAYSMTRLDQLARPRCPVTQTSKDVSPKDIQSPVRPPRHRSSGQLSRVPGHRSVGNLTLQGPLPPPRKPKPQQQQPASGLRSGEITPSSPSRPGSSLSSVSTVGGSTTTNSTMTSSVMGSLVNRRPRATPRRPRPVSIAGTGVTTPPHTKNNTVGADGKPLGVRAEKPPLPRVHSAGTSAKKPFPGATTPTSEKPEVPKRIHKGGTIKASPRLTPKSTPLQSPATDVAPTTIEDVQETVSVETIKEGDGEVQQLVITTQGTNKQDNGVVSSTTMVETKIVETVKHVTKEEDKGNMMEVDQTVTTTSVSQNEDVQVVKETVTMAQETTKDSNVVEKLEDLQLHVHEKLVEEMNNLNIEQNQAIMKEGNKPAMETMQPVDLLEGADMSASMMARNKITTEVEAKAALAERRRLAREEAERQAEKERLRLQREEEEEAERQRQEEERQRNLEEETIRLSELQRQAEEERLQQAIQEAQRRAEEEKHKREEEAKLRAEKELADARAREEAEKLRKETAERLRKEEEEREARRKRVEAIMLRTRQAKQKKDGDKSPSEENKSLEDVDQQKSVENKIVTDLSSENQQSQDTDSRSAYEMSVREREQDLFNHMAPHNQVQSHKQHESASNGLSLLQNGTNKPTNGDTQSSKMDIESDINQTSNFAVQNGHSKSQINELNNLINTSENQFNSMALDNNVILNNVSNNLLDMSDVDLLNATNKNNPFMIDVNTNGSAPPGNTDISQLLDFTTETSKTLVNEDAVNSNQTTNSPFISSFHDNQENRDLSLL